MLATNINEQIPLDVPILATESWDENVLNVGKVINKGIISELNTGLSNSIQDCSR